MNRDKGRQSIGDEGDIEYLYNLDSSSTVLY